MENKKLMIHMLSRQLILRRIRKNKPLEIKHTVSFERKNKELQQEEVICEFIENLKKSGAWILDLSSKNDIEEYSRKCFQNPVNLLNPNFALKNIEKEQMVKTDVLILKGMLGVAENGAIWFSEQNILNRLFPFVVENLILVLNKNQIVSTMHEAYHQIELSEIDFGVFISGPSKTADIEQSLVYGAHGAKELNVVILD